MQSVYILPPTTVSLKEVLEMGRECGLTKVEEAYVNVDYHAPSLFQWDTMEESLDKIEDEITNRGLWDLSIDEALVRL